MESTNWNAENLIDLFRKPKLIGIIGDANTGKSDLIYYMITELRKAYNIQLYHYGLRVRNMPGQEICSVRELEQIRNGVVFVDEFANVFDLDDRKQKKQIERSLRLIYHNNNVLVLSGLPENYHKFIAAPLGVFIYKRCTLGTFINGSRTKEIAYTYQKPELGSEMLSIPDDKAVLYDGEHYHTLDVPYLKEYDTKLKNIPIIVHKNVPENVRDNAPKM